MGFWGFRPGPGPQKGPGRLPGTILDGFGVDFGAFWGKNPHFCTPFRDFFLKTTFSRGGCASRDVRWRTPSTRKRRFQKKVSEGCANLELPSCFSLICTIVFLEFSDLYLGIMLKIRCGCLWELFCLMFVDSVDFWLNVGRFGGGLGVILRENLNYFCSGC